MGGGYIQGGQKLFRGGGGENKKSLGQVGSYISSGNGGGGRSDVFHWFLFLLKVTASGGLRCPPSLLPPPPIPTDTTNNMNYKKKKFHKIRLCKCVPHSCKQNDMILIRDSCIQFCEVCKDFDQ